MIRAADLFCGGGGFSSGLRRACERLGRRLHLTAVDHWPTAVETHAANHPDAVHLCESLDSIDPRKVARRLDLLLASPECTHHSIARGGRPVNDQSRASAWHVVRWAEALRPRVVIVENVREFATWGPLNDRGRPLKRRRGETYQAWLGALRSLGYTVDARVLNAADYGAATTRERLFVLAVLGRWPLPWPEPTHCREGGDTLFGPRPRWRAAREVIDWSLPGESIFARKRPLKPKTLQRIFAGLRKFGGDAFRLHTTHEGGDRVGGLDEPLPTVTGANRGEQALCQPFLVPFFGEREGQTPRCHSVDAPLPTVTGQGDGAVVQPFLVRFKGTAPDQIPSTAQSVGLPLGTVTAGGGQFGLCEPFLLQMSQSGSNGDRMRPASRPVPTITTADDLAGVGAFLVSYYGTGGARPVSEPLPTVTSRDRFAVVTQHGQPALLDIRFRMLQPHELAAAMSFLPHYQFRGNRGEVVRQIGNAVDVSQAEALCYSALSRREA